jgi:[protein-PII] uridylyltransferase
MSDDLCLAAVGGYGRGELHLHSDIDLLILIPSKSHKRHQKRISNFLTFLWDVGLEVGHATRDMDDCVVAIYDLSVVTSLLESRLLLGDKQLFKQMKSTIKESDWSSQSFFVEKQKEQLRRHEFYSETAYNLEPNLKESPGGLRDIHTMVWVAKWYFDVDLLSKYTDDSYLNKNEYDLLNKGLKLLWKIRFALHLISNRREDRLTFQYQKEVAAMLGYMDGDSIAVEQLMKEYYQTATRVSRLNDILMQLLEDRVLHTQNINERFIVRYGYIKMTNNKVFVDYPYSLIEIFLLISKHSYVRGISASTLREVQLSLDIIDSEYHKNFNNNKMFIELLQQKKGVNRALTLMNRYGVLERYVPVFGKIIGLMQYDLFHAYTVDQHTLFVIRNLRRFFIEEYSNEFALCSEIASEIRKPELLFLGGLFHDIAKGRGGDHSVLGGQDAIEFCKYHRLNNKDSDLVYQLVTKHLLMSQTAQKKDIDNHEVIAQFAYEVGSLRTLKYLYLLTVADIRATRYDLWNDWKDALLKKLFYKAQEHLLSDNKDMSTTDAKISKMKDSLMEQCKQNFHHNKSILQLFDTLPKDYFVRYEEEEIIWHLWTIDKYQDKQIIVSSRISEHNIVDVFVYSDNTSGLFYKLISIIERLGLNVVDAKIITTKANMAYNTISVLRDKIIDQIDINKEIEKDLSNSIIDAKRVGDKLKHRHFDNDLKITFSHSDKWNLTQLEINVLDKQGLLSNIAYIFYKLNINLINARISTLGERVEDVFFISNKNNNFLDVDEKNLLKEMLKERL